MILEFNKFSPKISGILKLGTEIAEQRNLPLFIVGGFVRDLLLKIRNLDIDLVVETKEFKQGIEFAKHLAKILNGEITIHRGFGTAVITYNFNGKQMKMDIANARQERYNKAAALPDVCPTDILKDLGRRDFSINAMAICLNRSKGRLLDPFKGREDLKKKRIRILHSLSFIDDPTRILRAMRFATRYNFHLEKKTKELIKEAIKKGMLKKLKPQRIEKEIKLILKEKTPIKIFSKLRRI